MKKPTIPEIQERIDEMGYDINAELFFAFYASKGWMIGKSPMKDWKMALVTWQGKRPRRQKSKAGSAAQWYGQCGDWLRQAGKEKIQTHGEFLQRLREPKFREWAESVNPIVKEIA